MSGEAKTNQARRLVGFRVSPEMLRHLHYSAFDSGVSVGQLVNAAVVAHIGEPNDAELDRAAPRRKQKTLIQRKGKKKPAGAQQASQAA